MFITKHLCSFLALFFFISITACGGGGGGGSEPPEPTPDTTAPVITLNGEANVTVIQGETYQEQGASATDNRDGNVDVVITGSVDINILGDYQITYTATDAAGNSSNLARTVSVVLPPDVAAPVISLVGDNPMSLFQGQTYQEPGATATDDRDGNLDVVISGSVDINILGDYQITYTATDTAGNSSSLVRTVTVIIAPDVTAPEITLNGENPMTMSHGSSYQEPGATANDDRDGNVDVVITGTVDSNTLGDYIVTYAATDEAGNNASVTRTVSVIDNTAPIISINGPANMIVILNKTYQEQGATASDNIDENLAVEIESDVDTSVVGIYTITYSATDAAGNIGTANRTISVEAVTPFITTWKTDRTGFSEDNQIKIGTQGSGYNYDVDWGDGSVESNITGDIIHTYSTAGTYTISITGDFPRIYFDSTSDYDNEKLLTIEQWGNQPWQSMESAFYDCSFLTGNATDTPNLLEVKSMSSMFWDSGFNQNINDWDVSAVTDMSWMFFRASVFNQDLSNWDVSSVTNMSSMFRSASRFNQDLSNWDVSAVTDMNFMFRSARDFNQDLSNWDVSAVTDMSFMFSFALEFNQPLNSWNVSAVTDMSSMFGNATDFNQNLDSWDVSSVTNMSSMFSGARAFNGAISDWDVSSVQDMNMMFYSAVEFDQNIQTWNVADVTNMESMFSSASKFNQDVSNWNVGAVTSMKSMFSRAIVFNQDLSNWNVSSVSDMNSMLLGAIEFNQDLSNWNVSSVTDMAGMFNDVALSTSNYDALLNGWSVQSLQNDVVFSGGNSTYSASSQGARDTLTGTYNWTVTDGGVEP